MTSESAGILSRFRNLSKKAQAIVAVGLLLFTCVLCGIIGNLLPEPEASPTAVAEATEEPVAAAADVEEPTEEPTEGPTEEPAPTNTPKPDLGKWAVTDRVNPLDDTRTVIVALDADEKVKGWLTSSRPTLVIQCKSGETGVGFRLGVRAAVESGRFQKHTIQVRIDKDTATDILTSQASEGDVLLVPNGRQFAASLVGRELLTLGFTPFEAPPAVTTFTLAGIDEAIAPLREACGW